MPETFEPTVEQTMRRRHLAWCATHNDLVPRLGNCCSMGGYYGEWDDCAVIDRFAVVGAASGSGGMA